MGICRPVTRGYSVRYPSRQYHVIPPNTWFHSAIVLVIFWCKRMNWEEFYWVFIIVCFIVWEKFWVGNMVLYIHVIFVLHDIIISVVLSALLHAHNICYIHLWPVNFVPYDLINGSLIVVHRIEYQTPWFFLREFLDLLGTNLEISRKHLSLNLIYKKH